MYFSCKTLLVHDRNEFSHAIELLGVACGFECRRVCQNWQLFGVVTPWQELGGPSTPKLLDYLDGLVDGGTRKNKKGAPGKMNKFVSLPHTGGGQADKGGCQDSCARHLCCQGLSVLHT